MSATHQTIATYAKQRKKQKEKRKGKQRRTQNTKEKQRKLRNIDHVFFGRKINQIFFEMNPFVEQKIEAMSQ